MEESCLVFNNYPELCAPLGEIKLLLRIWGMLQEHFGH